MLNASDIEKNGTRPRFLKETNFVQNFSFLSQNSHSKIAKVMLDIGVKFFSAVPLVKQSNENKNPETTTTQSAVTETTAALAPRIYLTVLTE